MQKFLLLAISVTAVIIIVSCGILSPGDIGLAAYRNTFETASDTAGWHGYGYVEFRADTPKRASRKSLYVSGGCIVPHFVLELRPLQDDCYLKICVWGKLVDNGGGVSLQLGESPGDTGSEFSVVHSDWTYYLSRQWLHCPAGAAPKLVIISGGFVAGGILVDDLEIIKSKFPY